MEASTNPFRECSVAVERLYRSLGDLERGLSLLGVGPLEGREWYELLTRKLLPQLTDDAFLVVAVVGGTNIGKSVIFNHIAGGPVSGVSPLASGTKHPVCIIPPGFEENHDLAAIFPSFELHQWSDSAAALESADEHRLFWKPSDVVPENLVLLDTPDIDSDAPVNWVRADHVRRAADLLIAVLTQQKYNDAAVKQFFRRAAEEEKAVIVVFNQCQLPDDEEIWPVWLETFCRETGVRPEYVYLAPADRRAAESGRLPFYERDPATAAQGTTSNEPHNLGNDLSRLHFERIKLQALGGSLKAVLDPVTGAPGYLAEIERRSADFQSASRRLSAEGAVRVTNWPPLPNNVLVAEVRQWWNARQEGWARSVNRFYRTVNEGVMWPIRFVRTQLGSETKPPLELYREREWAAVLTAVEEVFDKLVWMSESGAELLRPHFERMLAGTSRTQLLEKLHAAHRTVDLEVIVREIVDDEMKTFAASSPELYEFSKQVNKMSAAVRPATSVVLFTLGWGPGGEVVAPFIANAVAHAVVPIVADFAGGAAAAVAGEAAVSTAAGHGLGLLQTKLQRLQTAFTSRRVQWLLGLLKENLLGTLPEDLQAAGSISRSEPFRRVQSSIEALDRQIRILRPDHVIENAEFGVRNAES